MGRVVQPGCPAQPGGGLSGDGRVKRRVDELADECLGAVSVGDAGCSSVEGEKREGLVQLAGM